MSDQPKIIHDVALPLGRTEKGHLRIARIQANDSGQVRTLVGELHPLQDGVPITGDVLSLSVQGPTPFMAVETLVEDPRREAREARGEAGKCFSIPSQQFQDNWAKVFGKKVPDVN